MAATKTTDNPKTLPPKAIQCTCKHEYQDRVYGKGMRLHNHGAKKKFNGFACTVCGDKKAL